MVNRFVLFACIVVFGSVVRSSFAVSVDQISNDLRDLITAEHVSEQDLSEIREQYRLLLQHPDQLKSIDTLRDTVLRKYGHRGYRQLHAVLTGDVPSHTGRRLFQWFLEEGYLLNSNETNNRTSLRDFTSEAARYLEGASLPLLIQIYNDREYVERMDVLYVLDPVAAGILRVGTDDAYKFILERLSDIPPGGHLAFAAAEQSDDRAAEILLYQLAHVEQLYDLEDPRAFDEKNSAEQRVHNEARAMFSKAIINALTGEPKRDPAMVGVWSWSEEKVRDIKTQIERNEAQLLSYGIEEPYLKRSLLRLDRILLARELSVDPQEFYRGNWRPSKSGDVR